MGHVIKEVDGTSIRDVGKCDSQFVIDSELVLHAENNQICYTVVDRPVKKKRYEPADIDHTTYLKDPEKTIFLAYVAGEIAGQIILRKNWNNYAYVDDIAVDVNFRRMGIGQALIDQAKEWAREKQLAGIMLETQNTNVGACKFYEGCGFKLGGFDNYLYKGLEVDTDEVALFWYSHFTHDAEGTRIN